MDENYLKYYYTPEYKRERLRYSTERVLTDLRGLYASIGEIIKYLENVDYKTCNARETHNYLFRDDDFLANIYCFDREKIITLINFKRNLDAVIADDENTDKEKEKNE